MQQILIPIGIMVGLSILSWLVQQMKAASDKRQMQNDRERQRAATVERAERRESERPMSPPPPPAVRAGNNEVDRFMQEINRLRERSGAPPAKPAGRPTAKVIPTVSPVRKKKRVSEDSAPSSFPATMGQVATGQSLLPPPVSVAPRDELPMATLVGTPRIVSVSSSSPMSPPVVTKALRAKSAMVERPATPASSAGVQLLAMLKDRNQLAAAILLQEVLGPPKSKRL